MGSGLIITKMSVMLGNQVQIVSDFTLTILPGTNHALMAPNGSGKSTIAYALMGHPMYRVNGGSLVFNGHDITHVSADKRAKLGIFLAFQNPLSLPGVTVASFLKEAYQAIKGIHSEVKDFQQQLFAAMEQLGMDPAFAFRAVNDGFSGGEKKRLEMLQLLLLKPSLVILDEIDSGLDVDALKCVAKVLNELKLQNPAMSIIIITHYQRMLELLVPDFVHIMYQGRLVKSGDYGLVHELEHKGYDEFCK